MAMRIDQTGEECAFTKVDFFVRRSGSSARISGSHLFYWPDIPNLVLRNRDRAVFDRRTIHRDYDPGANDHSVRYKSALRALHRFATSRHQEIARFLAQQRNRAIGFAGNLVARGIVFFRRQPG